MRKDTIYCFICVLLFTSLFTYAKRKHTLNRKHEKLHHKNNKRKTHASLHQKKTSTKRSEVFKREDIEKELYLALLKRSDIADDLYKNVLPYIKEVAQDAAKTKEEIRQHRNNTPHPNSHFKHDKKTILKELDKKVLPWLHDITQKVNSLSQGNVDKLKEDLHITVDNIRKLSLDNGETKINKQKENNAQPNLLEYDENNRPILKKGEYKKKFDEFIKSKEKNIKKKNRNKKRKEKVNVPSVIAFKTNEPIKSTSTVKNRNYPSIANTQQLIIDQQNVNQQYKLINQLNNKLLNQQNNKLINQQNNKPINLNYNNNNNNFAQKLVTNYPQVSKQISTPFSTQAIGQNNQPVYNSQGFHLPTTTANFATQLLAQPPVNNIIPIPQYMPPATLNNPPQPQNVESATNKNIEFEVAELTNQIAEFQQEMDSISKDMEDDELLTKDMNPFRRNLDGMILDANNKNGGNNKNVATLMFAGNVGFNGIIHYKVEEGVCTYNESFDKIKPFLKKADHVVVNLDSVFMENDNTAPVTALSYAGIDTVTLANDGLLEYGPANVKNTLEILQNNLLLSSGVTKQKKKINKQIPVVYATNGITIALLSYCMNNAGCKKVRSKSMVGPSVYDEMLVKEEVQALRENGIDCVIVYLNWGNEENLMPTHKIKDIVKKLSPAKIDVLVGCHPYVESHYYYRGMLVCFNLGNFISPMHVQLHKSMKGGGSKSTKLITKLWYKQNERWEIPSIESKLLQVQMNRDGLVVESAKYLQLRTSLNKNHCPQPQPKTSWIKVCSKEDKHCEGTNNCNELECGSKDSAF